MKAVTYLRVSTAEQSLEPQRAELRAVAQARGWTVVREYSDVISGVKVSRTGFDAMMKAARDGEFGAIMATKIDRISRSLGMFIRTVAELDEIGVALVIPGQSIDTSNSNPAGRMTAQILGAVAEFERELIRERTRAGLAARKAAGIQLGRPSLNLRVNWEEIVRAHLDARAGEVRDIIALARELGGVSTATAWKLARLIAGEKKAEAAA